MKTLEPSRCSHLTSDKSPHFLDFLITLHNLFDGDFDLYIVFGAIGHYRELQFPIGKNAERKAITEMPNYLKRLNPTTLSDVTGIPRETVRRKIKKLIQMGYISIGERKKLEIAFEHKHKLGSFKIATLSEYLKFITKVKESNR